MACFSSIIEAKLFPGELAPVAIAVGLWNYFVPEATTRKDECWAITETMVPYKIGTHRTRWPLPGHMLVSPEGEGRQGVHWDGGTD